MVQNMKVGKMDGFCVGEPWNVRAIADGVGFTSLTTQQLWKDHPEKVLVFMEEFAERNPRTVKAVMKGVMEAAKYIDDMKNRPSVAEVVSQPQYINCPPDSILKRLKGITDYGDGRKVEQDPAYMIFFNRDATFPFRSHGQWWMTQFRRWGMVKGTPDYAGVTARVNRPDLWRAAAKELGIAGPTEEMKAETFALDGKVYDPAKPEEYATSFAVNNLAG
jgi:nitrate/nitrite transport system substrate-binding protein